MYERVKWSFNIYIYILIRVYPSGIMLDAFAECGISEVGQINKT